MNHKTANTAKGNLCYNGSLFGSHNAVQRSCHNVQGANAVASGTTTGNDSATLSSDTEASSGLRKIVCKGVQTLCIIDLLSAAIPNECARCGWLASSISDIAEFQSGGRLNELAVYSC
jgi:hypothetical protein